MTAAEQPAPHEVDATSADPFADVGSDTGATAVVADAVGAAAADAESFSVAGAAEAGDDLEGEALGSEPHGDDRDLTQFEREINDDLVALERERDDYLDALRRLQADFENYRKRVQKERSDLGDQALMALVESLLPVLDAATLALAHGGGEGLDQVSGLLYDTLAKAGLEAIDPAEGDVFDPNLHEAVAHDPGDGGDPAVAQVLRAGYLWKGRLLRAAMVKVKG